MYARTWNTEGGADKVGTNNGRAKIDRVVIDTDNARLVSKVNAGLRTKPSTFTFLHVSLPDAAGHAYGFMSPTYVAAVRETSVVIAALLAAVVLHEAVDRRRIAGAVLVAAATADSAPRPATYTVDVPGGTLTLTWTEDDRVLLTGPAVVVARGTTSL